MPTTDNLDPTTLRALAKRVEAGESGRGLDADIWSAATRADVLRVDYAGGHDYAYAGTVMPGEHIFIPPVTTSLDAVEALRMRVLPDCGPEVGALRNAKRWACIQPFGRYCLGEHGATAPTEPAARLAALLFALAAKVEGETADDVA